jgi:hypothetical protein
MTERLVLLSMLLALLVAPVRACDVTGKWRVTISTADGPITGVASFRQNGHAVTGWVGRAKTVQFQSPELSKETSSRSRHLLNPDERRPSISAT